MSFSRAEDTAILRFHQENNTPGPVHLEPMFREMTAWRAGNTAYLDINSNGIADTRIEPLQLAVTVSSGPVHEIFGSVPHIGR